MQGWRLGELNMQSREPGEARCSNQHLHSHNRELEARSAWVNRSVLGQLCAFYKVTLRGAVNRKGITKAHEL